MLLSRAVEMIGDRKNIHNKVLWVLQVYKCFYEVILSIFSRALLFISTLYLLSLFFLNLISILMPLKSFPNAGELGSCRCSSRTEDERVKGRITGRILIIWFILSYNVPASLSHHRSNPSPFTTGSAARCRRGEWRSGAVMIGTGKRL